MSHLIMSDHISNIAQRLDISDSEALKKAKELWRLMALKVPANALRKVKRTHFCSPKYLLLAGRSLSPSHCDRSCMPNLSGICVKSVSAQTGSCQFQALW
jgi:hypothetical protein